MQSSLIPNIQAGITVLALLVATFCWPSVALALPYGGAAPELTGVGLDGTQHSLTGLRGKWVYVDFWATWCAPCLSDLPEVVALANELTPRGDFAVLSVSLDEDKTRKKLEEVIKDFQIPYPVIYDAAGWSTSQVRAWQVQTIPATFLIDPDGRVVGRRVPPGLVRDFMLGHGQPGVDFVSLPTTSYQVLGSSATTGNPQLRDLVIQIDLGTIVRQAPILAFDLDVTQAVGEYQLELPELVVIRPGRAGEPFSVEFMNLPDPADPNAVLTPANSGLMLSIDESSQSLKITVPVPADARLIRFTLMGGDDARYGLPVVPAVVSLRRS